jgi:hypothetical protein
MFNGSYLIYVICVCLRTVVSNTYCGVFLLCLSSFCIPYVPSFSGLSILIALRYSLMLIETTKFRFIFDRCFIIFYIHKSIINIMKLNSFWIFTEDLTLSLNVFRQAIALLLTTRKKHFCKYKYLKKFSNNKQISYYKSIEP